jgi:hypothetical protein
MGRQDEPQVVGGGPTVPPGKTDGMNGGVASGRGPSVPESHAALSPEARRRKYGPGSGPYFLH